MKLRKKKFVQPFRRELLRLCRRLCKIRWNKRLKTRSAALAFRHNYARMKKKLGRHALEVGVEDWQKKTVRAFAIAAGFWSARKALGHEGACTIRLEF